MIFRNTRKERDQILVDVYGTIEPCCTHKNVELRKNIREKMKILVSEWNEF